MKNKLDKIIYSNILMVIFFSYTSYAAWNEMGKTEKLLKQLNDTTNILVDVSNSHTELSKRIIELTESKIKSSESMQSLTWQINILTWVLAIFALIKVGLEIKDRWEKGKMG